MKVYKFGGASVKNSSAVKNMCGIIENYKSDKQLVVVVSAMGKTTNALEELLFLRAKEADFLPKLYEIFNYHRDIIDGLFEDKNNEIFKLLEKDFKEIEEKLRLEITERNYNKTYDQIVSYGEIISTQIVAHYLNKSKVPTEWVDSRNYIRTDNSFREARVNWEVTEELIKLRIPEILQNKVVITQGFIGRCHDGFTTTLGREGSDFSAAIFAYCLGARSLTIWKDVPGVLNADPKIIPDAIKFDVISYNEAAEMTYYGATVIHPKTIKPLANKNIPLWVKSFEKPEAAGTCITNEYHEKIIPATIYKFHQTLISFGVKDYSFIDEKQLSIIFHVMDQLNIKINLMQNSAITFSICIDTQDYKIKELLEHLKNDFKIFYNQNLTLVTVKNYDDETLEKIIKGKNIVLEQKSRHTFQALVK
jgi:aspartate kinase